MCERAPVCACVCVRVRACAGVFVLVFLTENWTLYPTGAASQRTTRDKSALHSASRAKVLYNRGWGLVTILSWDPLPPLGQPKSDRGVGGGDKLVMGPTPQGQR